MRRSLVVFLSVVALALATSTVAFAEPDGVQPFGVSDPGLLALITDDDVFSEADLSLVFASAAPLSMTTGHGTQHYGPFASGSPDSGTCGNDWAQDTFERHFTVRQTGPTTYEIVEQFKRGAFVTDAGFSPGACQSDDGSSTVSVAGGITGSMHGYLVLVVSGMQSSTDPNCVVFPMVAPCNGDNFVASHFNGTITDVPTYFFHYAGKDGSNQVLIEHEWKNASCDRGGNHGDIAIPPTAPQPLQISVCP